MMFIPRPICFTWSKASSGAKPPPLCACAPAAPAITAASVSDLRLIRERRTAFMANSTPPCRGARNASPPAPAACQRAFNGSPGGAAPGGRRAPSASGEFPALAELRFQVLVGGVAVHDAALLGIPFELALELHGDHAQQHPLHERAGDAEVGARRVAALAGAN